MTTPRTASTTDARKRLAENAAAPEPVMSDVEGDVWDEFWDTDAARCCSCPSCNFYALDYEQHKDEPCLLRTLIERIITARAAAIEARP